MTKTRRRLLLVLLSLGFTFGPSVTSWATVHVVSNSECSNGNLAKSQNPPGQSDPAKKSYLAAARHSEHRDSSEEC